MRSARVLFALFASVALAQAAQEPTYDLNWRPKPEQTLRFKVSLEVGDEQERVTLDWDMRSKVLKIEPNGDYTVETTASNRTMGFLGQEPETEPGEQTEVARYNAKGEEIDPKKEDEDEDEDGAMGAIFGALSEFKPPAAGVKKGYKWSFDVKADPKKKSTAARLDYEVIGVEKVGELDAVRVNYTFLELSGEKPTKANGYFLIDAKDGSPVGMETITVNLRLDEETQGSAKLKMVRQ